MTQTRGRACYKHTAKRNAPRIGTGRRTWHAGGSRRHRTCATQIPQDCVILHLPPTFRLPAIHPPYIYCPPTCLNPQPSYHTTTVPSYPTSTHPTPTLTPTPKHPTFYPRATVRACSRGSSLCRLRTFSLRRCSCCQSSLHTLRSGGTCGVRANVPCVDDVVRRRWRWV